MKILIYGAGSIGCHLGYCLMNNKNLIYLVSRGAHYKEIKANGLNLSLCNNKKKILDEKINENKNIFFVNKTKDIPNIKFDFIFLTLKIHHLNLHIIKSITKFADNTTAIIPPCTSIPFWFTKNSDINNFLKNINHKNIIGMTMWISATIIKPGFVKINHTQRGYPLKEINKKMKYKADKLREMLNIKSFSPKVRNIKSEMFIKSLNSLAFNSIALLSKKNNKAIKNDKKLIEKIFKIMTEGEEIISKMKIKLHQTAMERINQTLSSTIHTMSMLSDYNNGKKIELFYLWKSFERVSKEYNVKMNFTKSIIQEIKNQISD